MCKPTTQNLNINLPDKKKNSLLLKTSINTYNLPEMQKWKDIIRILNPAVGKRYLLLIAAMFWGLISIRIYFLFITMTTLSSLNLVIILLAGFVVYIVFFRFIFFKLIQKHVKRIVNKKKKACLFGFFDLRSYGLFLFMVSLGIASMKFHLFGPDFLSILFLKLFLCLSTSAIYFMYYWWRFSYAINKFSVNEPIN